MGILIFKRIILLVVILHNNLYLKQTVVRDDRGRIVN